MHETEPQKLPAPVAVAWKAFLDEPPSMRKLLRLVDVYEVLLKYCAVVAIQNFYAASLGAAFPEVDRLIRSRIDRPSLGHWAELFREVIRCFDERPGDLFCPSLLQLHRQSDFNTACEELIKVRNQYVGHGATLSDMDAAAIVHENHGHVQILLQKTAFLASLPLLYVEAQVGEAEFQVKPLMGVDYQQAPSQRIQLPAGYSPLPVEHVVVCNPETNRYLDVYPLLLYTECTETIGGKQCRSRKVMFFNDLRDDQKRIDFLDYWQGHHSRFRPPNPVPNEFRQRFPKPEYWHARAEWFEGFVREWTAHFAGRRGELDAITQFVKGSPKKVLVVLGAPGMGKSALLAKWALEHGAVRHFLREGDTATYQPERVLENLAMQLSEKFGAGWQKPDRSDPALYRAAFDQILQNAVQKGQVVVVLDGIDEAVRAQTRGKGMESVQTIVDWLPDPSLLAEGVRMILSSRPELLEHRAFCAKHGQDRAEYLHLGRMTDEDVRALLYQVRSKYEVLEHEDYVQAVVQRSEGNPLYLRMLLEDIAEGRIPFGDAGRLPQGVIAYFERILEFIEGEGRTREMPDVHTLLEAKRETLQALVKQGLLTEEQMTAQLRQERDALEGRAGVKSVELLALYCLAKEPLTLEEAAQVLQADLTDAHRAFQVIRTVLVGDGEGRFAPFHSAFRDYLLNLGDYSDDRLHRHADAIQRVRSRLLDYCARWREHRSPYALRHYAAHLKEAGNLDALYALARDEAFLQAQRDTLPAEPDLPLRVLQTALDAAIAQEDVPVAAEVLLRHAQYAQRQVQAETPLDALRQGNLERAIGLAKQIMECDYQVGTLWLLLLAWNRHHAGAADSAERCLREILSWWEGKTLEKLQEWRGEAGVFLLTPLGGLHSAPAVAVQVLGDEARKEVAIRWAQAGQLEQALATAQQIEWADYRFEALAAIAQTMAQAGQREQAQDVLKQALKAAQQIKTDNPSPVLAEIAKTMAQVGQFEQAHGVLQRALKAAQQIRWALYRSIELARIAQAMVQLEQMEQAQDVLQQALETAKQMEEAPDCSLALASIARAMAQVGQVEQARDVLKQALSTTQQMQEASGRSQALAWIAQAMAQAGQFEQALHAAQQIEGALERSETLVEIAQAMTHAGRRKHAQGVAQQALEAAQRIEEASSRCKALMGIAQAMAQAGQFEQAQDVLQQLSETIQPIVGETNRSRALADVARAIAHAGQFAQALETAQLIENAPDRSRALVEVVRATAQAGQFTQALETAQLIERAPNRARALVEVAQAMAQAGQAEQAHSVLQQALEAALYFEKVPDSSFIPLDLGIELTDVTWGRNEVLPEVVRAMVQAGRFAQAIKAAQLIEWIPERSRALALIAQAMAQVGQFEQAQGIRQQALEVALQIEQASYRSTALAWIAQEMARAGQFEQALQVAQQVEEAFHRSQALAGIAQALARAGQFEQALQVAQQIETAFYRYGAWARISLALARAGQNEQAQDIWQQVPESVLQIDAKAHAIMELGMLVQAMVQAGQYKRAQSLLHSAWQVARDVCLSFVLWKVAETAARVGFDELAVEFAQQIAGDRINGLPKVLDALTERGAKGAVLQLLPLCGWAPETALHACSCLIRLYPEQASAVADVVLKSDWASRVESA